MAKRGPKPTPTPVLRLRQSWRAKKRGPEPDLDHKRPARPIWLKGEGRKCWERLCPILFKAGLVTELNRETLALLCSAWADYVEAEQQLDRTRNKDGTRALLIKTSNGTVVENPLLHVRNRAWGQVYKGAACFGLTPADIAGVRAMEKPTTDDVKRKFFGGAS